MLILMVIAGIVSCSKPAPKSTELLANMALVGEAIAMAMRTSVPWHGNIYENK